MAGEHEKTGTYLLYYVSSYLVLHCAMKTNHFTLINYALFNLSSIFFRNYHHNYAKVMIIYALELLHFNK